MHSHAGVVRFASGTGKWGLTDEGGGGLGQGLLFFMMTLDGGGGLGVLLFLMMTFEGGGGLGVLLSCWTIT